MTNKEIAEVLSGPRTDMKTASEILGIHILTAYKLAKSGELPAIRMGRKWVVPTARLREALGMPASD